MRRYITSRKKSNPVPPCGRAIEYLSPHSPFQKLIDAAIRRTPSIKYPHKAMTYNEVSEVLKVNKGSFWIWMHNKNGYPHPKSCKAQHLVQLSELLSIPLSEIKNALDRSRHLFTQKELPPAAPSVDAMTAFVAAIAKDHRKLLPKAFVLDLAKRLLPVSKR